MRPIRNLLARFFAWILRRRHQSTAADRAREIFHYHDGEKQRRIDPLVAWRRYHEDSELDPSIHFDQLESDDPKLQIEGSVIVSGCARRVFDLKPFSEDDPASVVDSEAIAVLRSFFEWVDSQKKSIETMPTSPRAMAEVS